MDARSVVLGCGAQRRTVLSSVYIRHIWPKHDSMRRCAWLRQGAGCQWDLIDETHPASRDAIIPDPSSL